MHVSRSRDIIFSHFKRGRNIRIFSPITKIISNLYKFKKFAGKELTNRENLEETFYLFVAIPFT